MQGFEYSKGRHVEENSDVGNGVEAGEVRRMWINERQDGIFNWEIALLVNRAKNVEAKQENAVDEGPLPTPKKEPLSQEQIQSKEKMRRLLSKRSKEVLKR